MQGFRFATAVLLNAVAVSILHLEDRQCFRTFGHQRGHFQSRAERQESVEPDVIFAAKCPSIREGSGSDESFEWQSAFEFFCKLCLKSLRRSFL